MRASAAIASRCLPPDDALVDHQDIDALAREPPAGGQTGRAAADDDHGRAIRLISFAVSRFVVGRRAAGNV